MKIVVDTSPLNSGHKTRGIGRYTRQLVDSLRAQGTDHKIVLTSKVDLVKNPDIIHYPNFDLFRKSLPVFPPVPVEVITIHDLTPLRMKDFFKPGIKSGLALWAQSILVKRMKAVITDSEHSKSDIIEFLSIPPEKINVIPLGVDKEFKPVTAIKIKSIKNKYSLPEKYLLYVGDVNPNKNLPVLLKVVAGLKMNLVIVSRAFEKESIPEIINLRKMILGLGINHLVTVLSSVQMDPVDDLAAIYSGASAYVQPSLYEGFGLPVLEAMACGVPVVSSNTSSLPEVAGEAALMVKPTEIDLVEGINKLLSNVGLRRDLIRKGLDRAKIFDWEKTASLTLKVYEKVAKI
ncbi:glycosyltransferase family 4 protein [Candidatus Collierbacteria bacterium]|nr:glycosyltransferase family 4 protein [Candidatus Collierbacteria bacterium]